MKRAFLITLLIVAAIAAGAYFNRSGRIFTEETAPVVEVIEHPTPTPTPELAPEEAAAQWAPGADEDVDALFTDPNYAIGHDGNVACGFPSSQKGFIIPADVAGENYPSGVYVSCANFMSWQARVLDPSMPEADESATPAAYEEMVEKDETVTAPAIAADDPLSFFTHDADAPEGPPSSIGWGPEENGFVVVVGVDIDYAEGNWEIPGSGCEQLLLLSGYMRNASIDDGSFWSYVVDAEVAAADPDTVLEYALLTARTWAFQQAEDEGCQDIVNPDAPLDHTWVGWENEDGTFTFVPYPEFRRSTGENNTTRFFKGDVVYGWHIGEGDSQDDVCDGGGCYLNPAPFDGWMGGGVINSTWPGEIPADAVNLAP